MPGIGNRSIAREWFAYPMARPCTKGTSTDAEVLCIALIGCSPSALKRSWPRPGNAASSNVTGAKASNRSSRLRQDHPERQRTQQQERAELAAGYDAREQQPLVPAALANRFRYGLIRRAQPVAAVRLCGI
jgi:hypothetical protein